MLALFLALSSTLVQSAEWSLSCLLEPSLDISVGTPLDGVLEQTLVDRGDTVRAGQVIARLSANVEKATVDYHAAKAEFGERKLKRNEELKKNEMISPQEADEMATEHRLAQLELKQKREELNLRTIQSPIDGVVVERFHYTGDLVRQEKIMRLAQIDPLFVSIVLPAQYFGKIQIGQTYKVTAELLDGQYEGKVSQIDKVIDPASATFRARLKLANPGHKLPSGLRCHVEFPG
jgi:RND family efflux transporter MFP subunit